ncbi:hypothetical protein Dimus_039160 [Dionaea muscipula]
MGLCRGDVFPRCWTTGGWDCCKIAEHSQREVTNPPSDEQISIDVLGKRSNYLKGYGIRKTTYTTKSQTFSNSEVLALKNLVENQANTVVEQSKAIVVHDDYNRKIVNMMFFIATKCGVDWQMECFELKDLSTRVGMMQLGKDPHC